MKESYKVCALDAEFEYTEKKSRFIAALARVHTEAQVKHFIDSIKSKYPDATHNCFAYRLREPRLERFSDDGEPAGTAGMPMLEVLKKEDVFDVCVVVTRYFGGVLLGTGGLIRAYGKCCSGALASAGLAMRIPAVTLELDYGYAGHPRIQKILEGTVHNQISCEFGADVRLVVSLPEQDVQKFEGKVCDVLCGDVKISITGDGYDSFKKS